MRGQVACTVGQSGDDQRSRQQNAPETFSQKIKGSQRANAVSLTNRAVASGSLKGVTTMINIFESSVYSEEVYPVSEAEHDEVMQMMADESAGFDGYGEWSAELEQPAAAEN